MIWSDTHPRIIETQEKPDQIFTNRDHFGVRYVRKEHIDYLIPSICQHYSRILVDWIAEWYAGIITKLKYQEKLVDMSMNE